MSSLLVPNSAWVLGLGWFYDCLIFFPSLAKYSLAAVSLGNNRRYFSAGNSRARLGSGTSTTTKSIFSSKILG